LTSPRKGLCEPREPARKERSRRAASARRRLAALILGALLPLAGLRAAPAQTEVLGEYQLKAAFLFNFAKFIEWPAKSFPASQSPFAICVLGVDPFGSAMDQAMQGKAVGDHPVAIERSKDVAEARQCQMIFVSSSEKHRVPEILEGLRGASALVVGETDGFAVAGGTVQFTLEENRVRFLINTDAAARAGLNVSSKLLSLAHVVHDSARNGGN
jgi:hypothetical protein